MRLMVSCTLRKSRRPRRMMLIALVTEVDGRRTPAVYADLAYPGADNTQMLGKRALKPKIAHQNGRKLGGRWVGVVGLALVTV